MKQTARYAASRNTPWLFLPGFHCLKACAGSLTRSVKDVEFPSLDDMGENKHKRQFGGGRCEEVLYDEALFALSACPISTTSHYTLAVVLNKCPENSE
uniref:Uncharacterized protein n=1 Tax=Chenopodium quinoa TaxID=63459 RepID=A0A803M2E1_CHEQI